MIRGTLLSKLATAAIPGVLAVILSSVSAYVAVTRGQANHETRITNVEKKQDEAASAMEKAMERSEQRLNKRLDEIQTDVREVRNGQTEMLREMARQK